ncbi:MAG: glucose-inhibited division protein A [Mariprofundaceae bacterium]|nr:glucose-inhibited division protein A [Mariprofundaceae bacterium]
MRQQLLNLHLPLHYEYGDWVRHAGIETAHNRLALWLVHGGRLWLTSSAPAGKTHLLHALAKEHAHIGLVTPRPETAHALRRVQVWLEQLSDYAYWVIDIAAGPIPQSTAIALFHLLERAREMNRHMVIAWRSEETVNLPPELASRLAALERIDMRPPENDHDLTAVLKSVAAVRQWTVDDAILQLILTHLPRHLPGIIDTLKDLENSSLAERKRLTQAWARKQIKDMRQQKQTNLPVTENL